MKRLFISILIAILVIGIAAFFYRYKILQYSAEALIRNVLPDYIKIDRMNFDVKNSAIVLDGFRVSNPQDFAYGYLLEIDEITCKYRMKTKSLLEGFEILQPSFKRPVLNIERLGDGRINLDEMKKLLEKASLESKARLKSVVPKESKNARPVSPRPTGPRTLHDIIKLPETFDVKAGKIIFIDRLSAAKPHMITFEDIDAALSIRLDDSYTRILELASNGIGYFNGKKAEIIKWTISLNPTTPRLTMSNRFEVSNTDIMPLVPYYDKYSPFIFRSGSLSGTLIFDFDNGGIGSTNEVRLSNLIFSVKEGYENAPFWETTVEDLAKYLTTASGEVVFDFKIKGEMSKPRFYLGPISKQALVAMAVDKISSALQKASGAQQQSGAGAPKSDIEKAKDYIDLFKGLINKK